MAIDDRGGGYSIKAAALAAGLSVETVRAWERRYGVVQARRDEAGHRVYAACDVARLRRLRLATERGHAIGKIAHAADAEIDRLVADRDSRREDCAAAQAVLARIVDAAAAYDVDGCDRAVATALALMPLPTVVAEVFAPSLREVGDRWHRGDFTVAQERLVSQAVRRQIAALLNCYNVTAGAATVVFATVSGEPHELGILMNAALAASRRVRVCYLGPDVPPQEIAALARRIDATAVAISLVMAEGLTTALAQLARLRTSLDAHVEIWIGGAAAACVEPAQLPAGTVHMRSADDFESRLVLLGGARP
jgi:MerR family transcriptional regulator, light-induced transcriptional regulator